MHSLIERSGFPIVQHSAVWHRIPDTAKKPHECNNKARVSRRRKWEPSATYRIKEVRYEKTVYWQRRRLGGRREEDGCELAHLSGGSIVFLPTKNLGWGK